MSGVGKHRAEVRPRYGRMSILGSSVAVTAVALLGGTGIIPLAGESEASAPPAAVAPEVAEDPEPTSEPTSEPTAEPSANPSEAVEPTQPKTAKKSQSPLPTKPPDALLDESLPSGSGTGRRVVFSESRQRVWLLNDDKDVEDTYLVSGSIYENLEPGTFEVFSRSEDAYGIDDSGTMKYFVRFTRGPSGAAIGFHDIPVKDGKRIQRFDELGTPLSHGCIRQKRVDAIELWEFAPIGTKVVVTA